MHLSSNYEFVLRDVANCKCNSTEQGCVETIPQIWINKNVLCSAGLYEKKVNGPKLIWIIILNYIPFLECRNLSVAKSHFTFDCDYLSFKACNYRIIVILLLSCYRISNMGGGGLKIKSRMNVSNHIAYELYLFNTFNQCSAKPIFSCDR